MAVGPCGWTAGLWNWGRRSTPVDYGGRRLERERLSHIRAPVDGVVVPLGRLTFYAPAAGCCFPSSRPGRASRPWRALRAIRFTTGDTADESCAQLHTGRSAGLGDGGLWLDHHCVRLTEHVHRTARRAAHLPRPSDRN